MGTFNLQQDLQFVMASVQKCAGLVLGVSGCVGWAWAFKATKGRLVAFSCVTRDARPGAAQNAVRVKSGVLDVGCLERGGPASSRPATTSWVGGTMCESDPTPDNSCRRAGLEASLFGKDRGQSPKNTTYAEGMEAVLKDMESLGKETVSRCIAYLLSAK